MSVTFAQVEEILCGLDGTQGIIQDSSYYAGIGDRINRAVLGIAAGIKVPDGRISPPLPELLTISTVSTSTSLPYVNLPSTYQRNLFMVADPNGNQIFPPKSGGYYAFHMFLRWAGDKRLSKGGTIWQACVSGKKLYYQDVPASSQTLTVFFYRLPVAMSLSTDTPDGIPEHLQEKLIKHFVCREIYGEGLEDGEQASRKNYAYHTERLFESVTELIDFCGIDAVPENFGIDYDDGMEW